MSNFVRKKRPEIIGPILEIPAQAIEIRMRTALAKKTKYVKQEGYDPLRPDKKAIEKPSDREMFAMTCNTARKMEKQFGRRAWMRNFIDEYGNNLPYKKGMVTDGKS